MLIKIVLKVQQGVTLEVNTCQSLMLFIVLTPLFVGQVLILICCEANKDQQQTTVGQFKITLTPQNKN